MSWMVLKKVTVEGTDETKVSYLDRGGEWVANPAHAKKHKYEENAQATMDAFPDAGATGVEAINI